jgi:hypothetical protein
MAQSSASSAWPPRVVRELGRRDDLEPFESAALEVGFELYRADAGVSSRGYFSANGRQGLAI